jgi:hypothetical protein
MNVCAACGEAMSEQEAFCSHCGVTVEPPAKPSAAWRRVSLGAAASGAALFGIGLADEGIAVAIVAVVLVAAGLFFLAYQIGR